MTTLDLCAVLFMPGSSEQAVVVLVEPMIRPANMTSEVSGHPSGSGCQRTSCFVNAAGIAC